jgi:hypothetical protein
VHQLAGGENAYMLSFYKKSIKAAGFSKLKVYAFWDSVLNYAPMQMAEVDAFLAKSLSKRIPFLPLGFFEKCVVRIPFVSYLLRRFLNIAQKNPGTLYAFEAIKS